MSFVDIFVPALFIFLALLGVGQIKRNADTIAAKFSVAREFTLLFRLPVVGVMPGPARPEEWPRVKSRCVGEIEKCATD